MDELIKILESERDKAQARYKTAVSNGMLKEIFFNLGRATAFSKAISIAKGMVDKNEVN